MTMKLIKEKIKQSQLNKQLKSHNNNNSKQNKKDKQ